jgi:hypothetical protein
MPSRDNAIELLPEFNLFRGRRLRQSLVPQFPDGDPLDTGVYSSDDPPPNEKKPPGGRPPSPAEFPTDVPAPSPHDVPAWEPVDDPPPDPDEAPKPRPIP